MQDSLTHSSMSAPYIMKIIGYNPEFLPSIFYYKKMQVLYWKWPIDQTIFYKKQVWRNESILIWPLIGEMATLVFFNFLNAFCFIFAFLTFQRKKIIWRKEKVSENKTCFRIAIEVKCVFILCWVDNKTMLLFKIVVHFSADVGL